MAPLDFGSPTVVHLVDPLRVTAPEAYDTLGGYLRAVRERQGDSLEALAEVTRIRESYLYGIENGDRSALPSRPFAIGYVRAYARALGLDPETAAARYKGEWPEGEQGLRNPTGLGDLADPRRPIIYAAVAVVVGAVALWNVAQRTVTNDDPAPPNLSLPSASAAPPTAPAGPVKLEAATPAPAESSLPPPYVTPGLDPAADSASPAPPPSKGTVTASPGAAAFETKAAILGSANGPLLLQARDKSVSLVMRRPDNTIAFAHVMQPREAFRAPAGAALTAEVSDPGGLDVYVNGRLVGELVRSDTSLSDLAGMPPPAPPAVRPVPALAAAAPLAAPVAAAPHA